MKKAGYLCGKGPKLGKGQSGQRGNNVSTRTEEGMHACLLAGEKEWPVQ